MISTYTVRSTKSAIYIRSKINRKRSY